MSRVGFVSTPLRDGNATRGVGEYTKQLFAAMKDIGSKIDVEITEIINHKSYIINQYDVIHYPFFDLFRHTLPIFRKTKTVVTIHDVIPLEYPEIYKPGIKGWINLQLQKIALSGVERVITDSYASVKAIHKHLGVPHEKLKLVYLAAGDDYCIKKVTKKYNLPKKFVAYLGDINWNKNIPGLVKACSLANIPLVMIGSQALEVEKMDLNHPQLKHLKDVDFSSVIRLGYVSDEDLVDILNLASVFCQASFAEGSALNVLKAVACGRPVACSDIECFREHLGDTAFYFDPHNIESIATTLKKALTSRVVYPKSKFSWEKTALETVKVYESIS